MINLSEDHKLSEELANLVGVTLLKVREDSEKNGLSAQELKDAGDQAAHQEIMNFLSRSRPNDGILSEEGADNLERLNKNRVWIVDPLDGTREFSEIPRTDWAVHIALTIDKKPVVGSVALPAQNKVLSTLIPPPYPKQSGDRLKVIVSRTRRPAPAIKLAEALNADYVEMGSAGAKAMEVVQGNADIYAHAGGQYEWDSCAPVAVATAAGFHCSRLDGSELIYNEKNPYLPDLIICRKEIAQKCLDILDSLKNKDN